jgi:hypothetical protein
MSTFQSLHALIDFQIFDYVCCYKTNVHQQEDLSNILKIPSFPKASRRKPKNPRESSWEMLNFTTIYFGKKMSSDLGQLPK